MSGPEKPQHSGAETSGDPKSRGLTRREWILRLGEAAVLAGFSGAAAESAAGTPALMPQTSPTGELPPGLYDPSGEHMAHVLFRDQRFINPPPGSETEYVQPHPNGFEPLFFSPEDFKVVRRLVALFLNARGAAVSAEIRPVDAVSAVDNETVREIAEWIDLVLSQARVTREAAKNLSAQHRELAVHYHGEEPLRRLETAEPEKTWQEGLAWIDQDSRQIGGQGFLSLTEEQQVQLLASISDSSVTASARGTTPHADHAGIRLYSLLKTETIRGYYTSRAGLKELDYKGNAFHPESPGCPHSSG